MRVIPKLPLAISVIAFSALPGQAQEHRARAPVTTLHVLDAVTGEELRDVRVVRAIDPRALHHQHPGNLELQELLVDREQSPVQVSDSTTAAREDARPSPIWVGAPGYVWRSLTIDWTRPGERWLKLTRGGRLELRLSGALPEEINRERVMGIFLDDRMPWVRLRRSIAPSTSVEEELRDLLAQYSDVPEGVVVTVPSREELLEDIERARRLSRRGLVALEAPAVQGTIVFDGIAPGEYSISIEHGSLGEVEVVARASVEIAADALADIDLDASRRPDQHRVELSGTLTIPRAWGTPRATLRFTPLDLAGASLRDDRKLPLSEMVLVDETERLYRWDAGEVAAATYEVRLREFGLHWLVETGSTGNRDVELIVAEPAEVTVKIVGPDGEPMFFEHVLWADAPRSDPGLPHARSAEWDGQRELHHFRAPEGPLTVVVMDDRHDILGERQHRIVAGQTNEITLRVRPASGVAVSLRDGPHLVPWHQSPWTEPAFPPVDLRRVGPGPGRIWEMDTLLFMGGPTVRLEVTRPGRYSVTVADQPGYLPVEPFEIEIPEGEFVERVVELQPDR